MQTRWRFALSSVLVLLATIGVPRPVLADGAPQGRIFVPGDHFQPGETITISGSELTDGSVVVVRLTGGPTIVELGRATVAADATLSTTATIPDTFPLGYAELTVRDQNGNEWSTYLLIGDRAEGPGAPSTASGMDERTLWLIVLGIGLIVFVAAAASSLRIGRRAPSSRD